MRCVFWTTRHVLSKSNCVSHVTFGRVLLSDGHRSALSLLRTNSVAFNVRFIFLTCGSPPWASGLESRIEFILNDTDAYDIAFFYNYGAGSPVAAAQGAAYASELLARLKNAPLTTNPFSANQTLDGDNATFPLGQSIYSDATHDVSFVS